MGESVASVVIADDSALMREGVAGLLERQGFEVVGRAADAVEFVRVVRDCAGQGALPDVVVADVRMPPGMADDGLVAALQLREEFPQLSVLVVSQYVAVAYAEQLLSLPTVPTRQSQRARSAAGASVGRGGAEGSPEGIGGVGYLLKDRIANVADFIRSLRVVVAGGVVVDPEETSAMMRARSSGLAELTEREREVLEAMARGLSNAEIAAEQVVSTAAVAKHVSNIFMKLRLEPGEDNRRVRAILTYLAMS